MNGQWKRDNKTNFSWKLFKILELSLPSNSLAYRVIKFLTNSIKFSNIINLLRFELMSFLNLLESYWKREFSIYDFNNSCNVG